MKKVLFFAFAMFVAAAPASAQKFFTRDAKVSFNGDTPLEKIQGVNKSGTAVIDTESGKMEWKVLVKNFLFEQALMQEHFNENYMESDKFSSATFKGALSNPADVNFGKDGTYKVNVKGTMEIHGVKKEIEVPGTITVGGGALKVASSFVVACADYNIAIPGVVRDKIAKEIKVTVEGALKPKQ